MFLFNYSAHVLSEDVIQRYVTEDGLLVTKKLLTKTSRVPKWGERFVQGPANVFVLEESIVDPQTQTLVTYTRNLGFTKIMVRRPRISISPASPDNLYSRFRHQKVLKVHVWWAELTVEEMVSEAKPKQAVHVCLCSFDMTRMTS